MCIVASSANSETQLNLLVEIQLEVEAMLGVINVGERRQSCTEARKTCNRWNVKIN